LVLFVTAVLLAGGCDWVREPIVHAGQWELDLMDTVVEFYYVNPDLPVDPGETVLKNVAREIAKDRAKARDNVSVYIFYDKEFAEQMAKPKTMSQFAKSGLVLGRTIFSSGDLGTEGGGLYKIETDNGDKKEQWIYVEKRQKGD